ncbi:MAG: type I restriction endonuclease subunit R [Saprospiraceae bacterium]
MANFIFEEEIQKELVQLFLKELRYDEHLYCEYDDSKLGRLNEKKVVSRNRLQAALEAINDHLPTHQKDEAIREAIREITRNRSSLTALAANKEVHKLLKDGFPIKLKDDKGIEQPEKVIYIDFHRQTKNHFMVVEELPIIGKKSCRTDLLVYVNGLPLVFIELKNSNVEVKNAYTNNLYRYKRDIPVLFNYNAFNILSNGETTKVGSYTASWEHFNEWKRIEDEKEAYDPEEEGISLERFIKGMCDKKRLLDILENFIFYFSNKAKIVAKNHQYIGVNNGIASFENRLKKEGKLGVFWHTQGSGKSYSMIFFAMKVFRKFTGDYTFVIVTDRDSLDDQIFKNFLKAEVISEKDEAKAQSREHLKTMLGEGNKKYIFTLIQKFGTEKGEEFPKLTDRKDIIVLVDEAHRTQYNTFAQNMRTAMPNANYLAFTGTPLLDANETTKEWFGEYVSEYNFAQSVEDGATVPIYYDNRVPEVQLGNSYINDDLAEIVEKDNLTPEQEERLKLKYANELEIIKRDSRLDKIAEDIVKHFPYREYRGKAMVISVDKYTTVKMYDKVQTHWKAEKRKLNNEISRGDLTVKEMEEKRAILKFMRETEMFVVISKEGDEEDKFAKQGLDIKPHRSFMDKKYGNEKLTLKDRFQKDDDPFRLVFLCSKWLTGFDSPTISTLYLDKPMQNHTLMQTIARANRVSEDKECGLVIDYFGVFENLEKAFEKYGKKHNKEIKEGEIPAYNKEALHHLLEKTVQAGKEFLSVNGCELDLILDNESKFKQIKYFALFANNLSKTEELRKEFNVHENAIRNIYQATQPDNEMAKKHKRTKEAYEYLRQFVNRTGGGGDYDTAVDRTRILMDESIDANNEAAKDKAISYNIKHGSALDLRNLNFEEVEKKFKATELKYLAIVDIKDFLQDQLERMLRTNNTRIDFAKRLQEIIDRYNAKTSDVNLFFAELKAYAERLRAEDLRAQSEGLTEEELQIFDLLYKEKLTKEEKQKVKLASKELLEKLKAEEDKVLVVDWHKNQRQRINVERYIMKQLYPHLEGVYDMPTFKEKSKEVFGFMMDQADNRSRGYA